MPELPEVENIRRGLQPILGRRILRVDVRRWDVVEPTSRLRRRARPEETPGRSHRGLLLDGVVDRLERAGKHLGVGVRDGRVLDVQLGMSGQLLYAPPGRSIGPVSHVHVVWEFDDGATLGFRDPRRFGGLWPVAGLEELRAGRWAVLGPDALEISTDQLSRALSRSRRAVKVALMDQAVVAGVGNIYVAEALFEAGIRPTRPAMSLTRQEARTLALAIRRVLRAAVDAGGSTLRDYVNAQGEAGGYQGSHRVYARAGEMCVRCGRRLVGRVVAQRATVWCASCQK